MIIDKAGETLLNFTVDERLNILFELRIIDNIYKSLPSSDEWDDLHPKGPSLEEKRETLEAERKTLWKRLQNVPPKLSKSYSKRNSNLPPWMTNLSSTPAADEIVSVPRLRTTYGFIDLGLNESAHEADATTDVICVEDDCSLIKYFVSVTDPNTDPFHKTYARGTSVVEAQYGLPVRGFRAQHDIQTKSGISAVVMVASRYLPASVYDYSVYLSSGIGMAGELLRVSDPTLPLYHNIDKENNQANNFSMEGVLTRRIIVEANELVKVSVFHMIDVFVNRGAIFIEGYLDCLHPDLTNTISDITDLKDYITRINEP
ncbi:MAG: hypothetical protein GY928_35365 [Colwellia sp.]|nr:hypothetical protein [Colwellia sp.]